MPPLVALRMYAPPELRKSWRALERALDRELRRELSVPCAGADEAAAAAGRGGERLLVQTCGYSVVHGLAGRVRLVVTPCYDAPGFARARYRSWVVVRRGSGVRTLADLLGARCAVNEWSSHSGMNALRGLVAPLSRRGRFFGEVRHTGSHLASLQAIVLGRADVAAIDCVTHALLARVHPWLVAQTRIIDETAPAPGLPLVVPVELGDSGVAAARRAFGRVLEDPSLAGARAALMLRDAEVLELSAYDEIRAVARGAAAHGYAVLA